MLFNSLTFLVFFLIVFSLHRLLPVGRLQKGWLLVASYVFYAAWNPPYVLILWFSTTLDWALARWIHRSDDPRRRRRLLLVSLVANLGLLAFFKYSQFLLVNTEHALAAIGIAYHAPGWNVVLPIGISFYTFASLSYTIDVYRGEIRGDWKLLDYALFVSFFPHLVAGPIVRAAKLLPQIEAPRRATRDQIGWGLTLTILGLFCKVVLADGVFAPVVDDVYTNPSSHGAVDVWAAVFGFSSQIYYDFGGYSLCAIGLALCFGYEFPDNFRFPYAARGFSDFWRRWHISLSSWLRDYLYIALGGNRLGKLRTHVNLMLTMLIGGLWHGASWMFVLWGGLHGALLATERRWQGGRPRADAHDRGLLPAVLLTFLVVTLVWIPFRSGSPSVAWSVLQGLSDFSKPSLLPVEQIAFCFLLTGLTLYWQFGARASSLEAQFARLGRIVQIAILAGCLIAMFLCSGGDERAFIYFQF